MRRTRLWLLAAMSSEFLALTSFGVAITPDGRSAYVTHAADFDGPPGTGKTSLVSALASRFGMSVYVVDLTHFSDRSLKKAVNDAPEKSMILFEDVDCGPTR